MLDSFLKFKFVNTILQDCPLAQIRSKQRGFRIIPTLLTFHR